MRKKILAVMLVALLTFSAVPVMAENSPTAPSVFNVTVEGNTVGKKGASGIKVPGGSISVSDGAVQVGKEVTLKVTPDKGKKFSKWIIKGDYTIVSGSLKDGTITIIPNGDIDIDAKFTDVAPISDMPETESNAGKGDTDSNTTSPKTGVPAGILLVTLLASGGVAVTSRRKYSK